MTRQERLVHLARMLDSISRDDKARRQNRETLKSEFFQLLEEERKEKPELLPVITAEVPLEFFECTGISYDEFIETRYPGWIIEHLERNITTDNVVFVLRRDPMYVTDKVVIDNIQVSKVVAEYTPEIDWESLEKENPELLERISRTEVIRKIDDDKMQEMMEHSPADLAILRRHTKVRKPSLKVTTSELANNDKRPDSKQAVQDSLHES